jgi:hypothetical protein
MPSGELVFLANSTLDTIYIPPSRAASEPHLHRPYFGMHRIEWTQVEIDPGGVESNLTFSEWLRLFRNTGFEELDDLELEVPEGSPDRFATPGEVERQDRRRFQPTAK